MTRVFDRRPAGVKYDCSRFNPSQLSPNDIDRIQIGFVGKGGRVLEIGCATGFMSEYMREALGCSVVGVELSPEQAILAEKRADAVICGSVEASETRRQIDTMVQKGGGFNTVFASQVVEHLADPAGFLSYARRWLASDGILIVSTCNVAHWTSRLALLLGNWEYCDYGIMDRNHLRFFTLDSFKKLLEQCGYHVMNEAYSVQDFCISTKIPVIRNLTLVNVLRMIPLLGHSLRRLYISAIKGLITYQFVYTARPACEC